MPEFTLKTYLKNIGAYYSDDLSSEMSYRTDFQRLLELSFPKQEKFHIQHDPKAVSGNKPDFIVIKDSVPILYIEVKKVGEDLDKIEKSDQAVRYFGYTNLIISDYLNFRFYRNGKKYCEPLSLGELLPNNKQIKYLNLNDNVLLNTIKDFTLSQKEPIKSGEHLAKIMGGKALRIRDNIIAYMNREKSENQELINIMNVIKQNLISEVDIEIFADIYAQTIVYGLFVARYNDKSPDDFTRQEARELIPESNPFLQKFFDHIAGSSFPKRLDILVSELCEVFLHANVHDLMEDYYNNKNHFSDSKEVADPVIHFYEDFLLEYNPEKKIEMGVFYTPKPVVNFIVRSIDIILKNEFNIANGLMDNQKILHELSSNEGKKITKYKSEIHRVQILDIATGTGTFLNETIKFIYESFKGREGKWQSYVNSDLIPRLYGFELMMASYTIAHLKLEMTLADTGISKINDRINIYLTNTLDEIQDYSLQGSLFGFIESIADESQSASKIKNEYPIMVVMGNPPYSGFSQNKNYLENKVYKVEPGGKEKLNERKHWLDDDYVKFIRFAESMIEKNSEGIVGMITAHGYIDNPTFRGMRWHLRKTFDKIYVLDLHGNSNKKEISPDGTKDENVFDIKTGVSIILAIKNNDNKKGKKLATVYAYDLFGLREVKQKLLNSNDISTIEWLKLPEDTDTWKPSLKGKNEYLQGFSINKAFTETSVGFVTAKDAINIGFSKSEICDNINYLIENSEQDIRMKFNLKPKDSRDWKVKTAKKDAEDNFREDKIIPCHYRPFDIRYTFYSGNSRGVYASPQVKIMKNFLIGENIGLVFVQRSPQNTPASYIFISNKIISNGLIRSDSVSIDSIAPLYIYSDQGEKKPNIDENIWTNINKTAGETQPEDILDYIYAYLHNPIYRNKYRELIKTDYPRIPYPESKNIFWELVKHGKKLRNLHLLNDPIVNKPINTFPIAGSNLVTKYYFKEDKIYINDEQFFGNVTENVWNFYIGGYQPLQKYLKERKNRILTNEESDCFEQMIVSISETISTMDKIENLFSEKN